MTCHYAYGNIRATTGSVPTDFGFTGQRRDASANLMYYGARYYDSALARFITADTIVPSAGNPQSLNRYSYTLNNPNRYNDPDGRCVPLCLVPLAGAAISAGADLTVQILVEGRRFSPTEGQDPIDGGRVVGAAVGGAAYSTAVLLSAPLIGTGAIGAGALVLIGGGAGIFSGQLEAYGNASFDELWFLAQGQGLDGKRWQGKLRDLKTGDADKITADFVGGAASLAGGQFITNQLAKRGLVNSAARSAILKRVNEKFGIIRYDPARQTFYVDMLNRPKTPDEWRVYFATLMEGIYASGGDFLQELIGEGVENGIEEMLPPEELEGL